MRSVSGCCRVLAGVALVSGPLLLAAQTRIDVGDRVVVAGVKRFGMNLSGQTFYDSGQMLRNLVFRNPGFEGATWQSIVRCRQASRAGCVVDGDVAWPTGFMDGAIFEVATGAASGTTGRVWASGPGDGGYRLAFAGALRNAPGDGAFLVLRVEKPGTPTAGWWTDFACGAGAVAERQDLPAATGSRQALRVNAMQPCGRATVSSYFDSTAGRSFVRLRGMLQVRFWAKPVDGRRTVHVTLGREGSPTLLDRDVALQVGWKLYTVPVQAAERAGTTGTVGLRLTVEGAAVLLDDVSLEAAAGPGNVTAFRDEVVSALRELRPGVLRYMDNGTDFGTSLDNWIAPVGARQRAGYSTRGTQQDDVSLGLHEFLQLAEAVGAEPWVTLPAGFSPEEGRRLVEYLVGSPETPYGAKRAARGRREPWAFPVMHLELGNEQWNRGSFAGATIDDAAAYGERAGNVFRAMRAAPGFVAGRFDLVAGSWVEVSDYTWREAKALNSAADTLAIAPYVFNRLETAPGAEGVYGAIMAEPEGMGRPGGQVAAQAAAARAAGRRLAVYEVNLGTVSGGADVSQAAIDRTVPTIGAAVAVADHMLLMLREHGVTDQCFFALPEFRNNFTSPNGAGVARTTPLFGAVVDMGGQTGRRRPVFYALAMLNRAMLANLVETRVEGLNPTWDQPRGGNSPAAVPGVHLLQSFAFADGKRRSLAVLNLSRAAALPVRFGGVNAPRGAVEQTVLTAREIEVNNEDAANVLPKTVRMARFDPDVEQRLPPFSLTTYTWVVP